MLFGFNPVFKKIALKKMFCTSTKLWYYIFNKQDTHGFVGADVSNLFSTSLLVAQKVKNI